MPLSSFDKTEQPWERWTEEEWRAYQATLLGLNETDEQTLAIILYHLQDPPLSYKAIAAQMNLSEGTIRLRIGQFYNTIRRKSGEALPQNESEQT